MAVKNALTHQQLCDALFYDQETGIFTRTRDVPGTRFKKDSVAGTRNSAGYWKVMVCRVVYPAHRLAWLYVYGSWPDYEIDHINGDPGDNRISNLRIATHRENMQNLRRPRRDNNVGLMGVEKIGDSFSAHITLDGRHRRLGMYPTPQEAHEVYLEAKRKAHPFSTL